MSPQLTPDQLAQRSAGIGASESAMMLGLSPFGGPHALQARKLADGEQSVPSWAQRLGQLFESAIADAISEREGWKLRAFHRTIPHPTVPFMYATPDYDIVGAAAGLEIKKSERGEDWGDDGDPLGVPVHVRVQAQHQMACVPRWDRVWVAVLLFGRDLRLYPVDRNPNQVAHLEATIPAWWQRHIVERVPLEPDGSDGATAAVRALYPREDDVERDATPEEELFGEELLAVAAEEKAVVARKELLRQRLMHSMGTTAAIAGEGWRATWRPQKGRIDWEACARERGATDEDGERFRPAATRSLRVTEKKADAKRKAA